MKPFSASIASGAALLIAPLVTFSLGLALPSPASAQSLPPVEKMNAYVGCINSLSERAYDSRRRYFSWAAKKGPTGKERIIYGTYTISDTSRCRKDVEKANAIEPHDAPLEAAASAYADAAAKLEPLLKEADDYYEQQNYKDDKMAKGKALHPQLVAAWDAFEQADKGLRNNVEAINDRRALVKLAEIEKTDGKKARYYVEALMIGAKRVLRAQTEDKPDLALVNQAIGEYEESIKGAEQFTGSGLSRDKVGSIFLSNAKSYLVTAKQLMRRVRDHVPYSTGDKMMLNSGGGAWMVEGSPQRLLRDYNQLVEGYNRGANI